jgi:hypothetical protein
MLHQRLISALKNVFSRDANFKDLFLLIRLKQEYYIKDLCLYLLSRNTTSIYLLISLKQEYYIKDLYLLISLKQEYYIKDLYEPIHLKKEFLGI